MKTCGTIRLDNAAGEGQARFNKHFERMHQHYVNSRKKDSSNLVEGLFIGLSPELQESLIVTAKRGAPGLRKVHDDALNLQKEADLKRHQLEHEKNIINAEEKYIESCNFYDRHNSERCWKNAEDAWEVFDQLNSESARVKAVKEQIMIRTKGSGWDDAAHPWSKNGQAFSSDELMKHFIETVLPMEK